MIVQNTWFFKKSSDLILIHYSDQYTSSANYDAITVTSQKELYGNVVGGNNIIREFNAFNGAWLIQMIAEKDPRQRREKRGIIAAYKYMTALVDNHRCKNYLVIIIFSSINVCHWCVCVCTHYVTHT